MGHTNFRGENSHEWQQVCEIRESFLPRKFPAIRYIIALSRFGDVRGGNNHRWGEGEERQDCSRTCVCVCVYVAMQMCTAARFYCVKCELLLTSTYVRCY